MVFPCERKPIFRKGINMTTYTPKGVVVVKVVV